MNSYGNISSESSNCNKEFEISIKQDRNNLTTSTDRRINIKRSLYPYSEPLKDVGLTDAELPGVSGLKPLCKNLESSGNPRALPYKDDFSGIGITLPSSTLTSPVRRGHLYPADHLMSGNSNRKSEVSCTFDSGEKMEKRHRKRMRLHRNRKKEAVENSAEINELDTNSNASSSYSPWSTMLMLLKEPSEESSSNMETMPLALRKTVDNPELNMFRIRMKKVQKRLKKLKSDIKGIRQELTRIQEDIPECKQSEKKVFRN